MRNRPLLRFYKHKVDEMYEFVMYHYLLFMDQINYLVGTVMKLNLID